MPKRSLLLLLATFLATPAHADTVTIGVWDPAAYGTNAVVPYFTTGPALNTLKNQFFGTFGGNSSTVAFGNADGTTTYEFAIDNVFATQVDTARIYASWTGITAPLGQLTIPTIFQVNEGPNAGFSITEQTFICAGGTLFCDNFIVGGGTPLGAQAFPGAALGTFFPTFGAVASFHRVCDADQIASGFGLIPPLWTDACNNPARNLWRTYCGGSGSRHCLAASPSASQARMACCIRPWFGCEPILSRVRS